jgi:N-acyl-D-aspartate/D-glutamate deacylase
MMAAMSRAADRPLNWNAVTYHPSDPPGYNESRLGASDFAAENGGAVFALMTPVPIDLRINFLTGFLFDVNPYWKKTLFDRSVPERIAVLRDPDQRRALVEAISGESNPWYNLSNLRVSEVHNPALSRLVGLQVGEIAAQTHAEPADALFDLLVEDDLRTVLMCEDEIDDDVTWTRRADAWNDPRVIVGASDAGAHLDMMTTYGIYSTFAGDFVRAGHVSMEKAIHLITDRPARLFGLSGRGRLAPGWFADVVVFDPETLSNEPPETVADLPSGAARLVSGATGVDHVIVNGVEILREGKPTGALPGRLLRSGIDTETVTVADAHRLSTIP